EVTGPYDKSGGISAVAPYVKPISCGGCWKHFKYEDDTCRTLTQGSCMDYLKEPAVLQACQQMLARGRNRPTTQPYPYPAEQPPAEWLLPGWVGSPLSA